MIWWICILIQTLTDYLSHLTDKTWSELSLSFGNPSTRGKYVDVWRAVDHISIIIRFLTDDFVMPWLYSSFFKVRSYEWPKNELKQTKNHILLDCCMTKPCFKNMNVVITKLCLSGLAVMLCQTMLGRKALMNFNGGGSQYYVIKLNGANPPYI